MKWEKEFNGCVFLLSTKNSSGNFLCVCVNILPKSAENVPFDRASSVNFEKVLEFFCPASWYVVGER